MIEDKVISRVLLTVNKYSGEISSLKTAVSQGEYTLDCSYYSRLLVWKTVAIVETLQITEWDSKLHSSRVVYHQLSKDTIVPWHSLEPDNPFYVPLAAFAASSTKGRTTISSSRSLKRSAQRELTINDPLSEVEQKISTTGGSHDSDLELLQAIMMDIERLFPGEEFFRDDKHRKQLIEVLYVWSKCNLSIGYKQGIHEILGLIYFNMYKESIQVDKSKTTDKNELTILNLYNQQYLKHDLFTIFNKFMVGGGIITTYYDSERTLIEAIDQFNVYLMKVDQVVYYTLLHKLKLESQLWIMRYFRLLLSREINDLNQSSAYWDLLICTPNLSCIPELMSFCIVVLLIRVKHDILTGDFSECLELLLHYPLQEPIDDPNYFQSFQVLNSTFMIGDILNDAFKLYEQRSHDLKLYELGLKLNKKYNPNLRVSMSFSSAPTTRESSPAKSSMDKPRLPSEEPKGEPTQISNKKLKYTQANLIESRANQAQFEKMRMEMRLKKKVQQMLNSPN
ncbi:uncharacterized protein KQ657_000683 [Scheffersomyces spartinae]|uniref:Rab-GAP TBC domain-containing protein n=1 Tax=Scheffersomyces spartinae TaxID=45513 RepID=A0A9P7V9N9_9ASCO|nr:uncharacterized protein KQ657_000683 [Scheffersomyces spartinae]KAG7193610.1 hypothetical protein KQ657_000683 [Scheffersomyces spartinae]